MIERVHWLGHASFRLNGPPHEDGPVIYIDPWHLLPNSPSADLILISHDHHDHCSPADIELIRRPDTIILSNQRVANMLGAGVRVMRPWQTGPLLSGPVAVRAVPAYTVDEAYHAKAFGGLGFVISMMHHDIYYAGDTDLIPEMDTIGCDIALLPVGGAFTMNPEEAVQAVERIKPLIAVPMHYGREVPGSKDLGRAFVQMVNSGVQAMILPVEDEHIGV